MKITVLDAGTLGDDISLKVFEDLGECVVYDFTSPDDVAKRLSDCDVAIVNKIKINKSNLVDAKNLRLICVTATGYDNIDIGYCKERGIAVCNVAGYSSHSVAQLTVATVLALSVHLNEYCDFVKSGDYSAGSVANKLTPVFNEIYGKTWGILGLGNIGREVGKVAKALGCRLLVCKRKAIENYDCVDIDTLCREADIITIHTPLNSETRHVINRKRISMMKKSVILVNAARGAVIDEAAVADALKSNLIGAFGCDVYSEEPFGTCHPFYEIKEMPNVLLTPHMAWGAYEARMRCIEEIAMNIRDFYNGGTRYRVDL